jgi:hypothetical protein
MKAVWTGTLHKSLFVIASAAKQSRGSKSGGMDCFIGFASSQ